MEDTAMTNPELWQQSKVDEPHGEVRLEKIEFLKAAIANGTYSISAEDIAEKIIESILEHKLHELKDKK